MDDVLFVFRIATFAIKQFWIAPLWNDFHHLRSISNLNLYFRDLFCFMDIAISYSKIEENNYYKHTLQDNCSKMRLGQSDLRHKLF
jgi:hypothetical protein